MTTVDEPPRDSFTLFARPSPSGFFGLAELKSFVNLTLEPYVDATSRPTLILDYSAVKVWDIAALLWLSVGLHYYRHSRGLLFLLRLPEGADNDLSKTKEEFDKSADYLRRWRFDRALRSIDSDIERLLVSSQRGYFDPPEPRKFYKPAREIYDPGLLQSLISRRLAEIRSLGDPTFTGSQPIPASRISQCVREFQAERIGDILAAQCGIKKRKADLFSDHLLTEALLNVQEHPNATMALVAISLMGITKELILTVVDNGDSIPGTIFERYQRDNVKSVTHSTSRYAREQVDLKQRSLITDYATKKGVTRKMGPAAANAGMGLTYIREDCIDVFHGKFRILTDGVQLKYSRLSSAEPQASEWPHPWQGNLLRIAIPVSSRT